ncbi:hypothetical protein MMYC01_205492 [Madurella mycetomatis]|uniref:Uncharacterized protein n=1 Tax=Madurella mycetomatis TaxID=100816 RepID=A0A175W406_9PEZI|nr:hypothetical protein MMYC01_205492 [Madurella mycetomatis]
MDLVTLAEELRNFKSTLPSDKIYGIGGLTSENDNFTVDYSDPWAAVLQRMRPHHPGLRSPRCDNTLHIGDHLLEYIDNFDSIWPIPLPRGSYDEEVPVGPVFHARRVQRRLEVGRAYHRNILRIALSNHGAGFDPVTLRETLHSAALWRTFICNHTRDNKVPDPMALPYAEGFIILMGAVLSEDKGPR